MGKKHVPGHSMTFGEYMQKRYPELRDIPAKVLEEPFLAMVGLRESKPDRKSLELELKRFEKNPAGRDGDRHVESVLSLLTSFETQDEAYAIQTLRRIMDAVDLCNRRMREEVADRVMRKIVDWADGGSPEFRKAVLPLIRERILGKTAIGNRTALLVKERTEAGQADASGSGQPVVKHGDKTLIALIQEHVEEDSSAVPDPGVSRVYHLQVDRNGKVHDVEAMSKEEHERIWQWAARRLVPKSRRMKVFAAIGAGVLLTFSAITITCLPEIRISERWQRFTADRETIIRKFREAVTMRDEVKIKSRKIINDDRVAGPFSIQQIFSLYDYAARKIKYHSDSHPVFPQPDHLTQKAEGGDCKSKSALLASWLETAGAKTVIFAMTYENGDGHSYVGVRLSKKTEQEIARAYADFIVDQPYRWAKEWYRGGGDIRFLPEIRQIYEPGIAGIYLILDPSVEDVKWALPGRVASNERIKKEIKIETQPGMDGLIPKEFDR